MTIVLKEVKRIDSSVTDFLEFGRPSDTKMSEINLTDIIRSSLRQVKPQIRKRGISIVDRIENSVAAMGDEEKIHQVLLNLLLNAIDESPDGSSILVSLQLANGEVIISIKDTGCGITEENATRVFEPFFTTKPAGTGLGLAIAKSIVDRHHGQIHLMNAPGGGAVAEIRLPLASARKPS